MQAVDAGVGGGDWLLSGLELVQVDESLYRTQNGRFIVARRGVWWLVAEHERALAVPITRVSVRALQEGMSTCVGTNARDRNIWGLWDGVKRRCAPRSPAHLVEIARVTGVC